MQVLAALNTGIVISAVLASSPSLAGEPAAPAGPTANRLSDDTGSRSAGDDDDSNDEDEIVVRATLSRGSVRSPMPAVLNVDRTVIRALGADNLSEVLDSFAAQARSLHSDGDAILLLNGRRIGTRGEIADIPPQAILRLEIFPEEVALQYGYPPTQRVINIILRRNYRALEFQARTDLALGQGRSTYRFKTNLVRLTPNGRINFDLGYRRQERLRDEQYGNDGSARDRLPQTDRLTASGTFGREFSGFSLTAHGDGEWRRLRTRLGMEASGASLRRHATSAAAGGALTFGGEARNWLWSSTAKLDWRRDRIGTNANRVGLVDAAWLSARSLKREASLEFNASGPLQKDRSDGAKGSFGAGMSFARQSQRDLRQRGRSAEQRRSGWLSATLDLPLLSDSRLGLFGEGRLEAASGEDALGRYGLGIRATPVEGLQLIAAANRAKALPDFDAIAATRLVTPNVRVYDFTSGTERYLSQIEGGNPALRAPIEKNYSIRLQYRPWSDLDISLSSEYLRTRSRGAIIPLLGATPQVEAAFSERFTRDPAGDLIGFDNRGVNAAHEARRQFRSGINLTLPIGHGRIGSPSAGAVPGELPEPTDEKDRGDFAGAARPSPRKPQLNQLQFALYHTWTIEDDVRLVADTSSIDLLHGAAVGADGGVSLHKFEGQLGLATRRFGLRLTGNWQSSTRIFGTDVPGQSEERALHFNKGVTLDARMYVNLGLAGEAVGLDWLKGRLNLSVNNILGTSTRIRDADGSRIKYYRGSDDDAGRTIRLSFRKILRKF